ncbi:MAG: Hint domain-containing protein [Rhodospirillales bacterium]|nr:Hint domain-containing protein [Rhodospirillales bacterium]
MQLNVLLRGQSNAALIAMSQNWPTVATQVEHLLGFDGVTNTVNLLERMNDTNNDNTLIGGTAFVGDWVQPAAGGWQTAGWTNNTLETGILNFINELPAAEKAAPTAVVWLQNEYDSTNPNLTAAEWTSAVRFDAQQVRQAFGQPAAAIPYVFVNAIPYGSNTINSVNQAIKLGMAQLAADPAFNGVVGVQADDLNMDGTFYGGGGTPGVYGGPHMSPSDANLLDHRIALAVAESLAAYALPGSPVALGQVDAYGPEAVSAARVAADQVLVTASLDLAALSTTLDTDAANGVGWSIIDNGQTLDASAAQVTAANQVRLTFASSVPAGASATLYYAYGYGRLGTGSSDPGQGNAIYDTQQMPLWTPAAGIEITACYAAGTGIAIARGEIAVERLQVGDRVVTLGARGATLRPVRWIGRARIDLARHPHPERVAPVRIRAGAFADGVPRRDLLLSPDHAVFVDGALIPVRLLLNGATVVQEPRTGRIRYLHIELGSHDVVLAEGLPAESYLDTGNRAAFDNGGKVQALHPDFAARRWNERGCAPLLLGGAAVAHEFARLRARAEALGYALTAAPDLRVLVGGVAVPARHRAPGWWDVRLPPRTQRVRLLSRTLVPEHIDRTQDDRRCLGIALTGIALDGHAIALASPALAGGFHPVERDGATEWRWTEGDAVLRLAPSQHARTLELRAGTWARYWQEPHGAHGAAVPSRAATNSLRSRAV